MNFLKRLFSDDKPEKPEILFGRSFEQFKTSEQLAHWDDSVRLFDTEQYLDSIVHFFHYLKDSEHNCIHFSKLENSIEFCFVQGSRIIEFKADQNWFRATVDIVQAMESNVGLLRRLLESSYKLIYGRYCLKEKNCISIVFDGHLQEASPYKLLEGLKEIALRADKEDDLLLMDFVNLFKVNTPAIYEIPISEKTIKYKYFKKWIDQALLPNARGKLDKNRYPGASVYIFLSTYYTIDYLLTPEGKAMEVIESTHEDYFEKNGLDLYAKALQLEKSCLTLQQFSEEKFTVELYKVFHTFPITTLVNTKDLSDHIGVELEAMQWYYSFQHYKVCEAICTYIVGSNFYNYTLPRVTHELMHLYYELIEPNYFKELGYEVNFDLEGDLEGTSQLLIDRCRKIIRFHLKEDSPFDPYLKFNTTTRIDFLISFLTFIQHFHY